MLDKECNQCRCIIAMLKQEIEELIERQDNLKRINSTLTEALELSKTDIIINWKEKYEEEVKKSHYLQKKLIELQLSQQAYQTPSKTAKKKQKIYHVEKENIQSTLVMSRQKSLKKMDALVDNLLRNRAQSCKYDQSIRKRINSTGHNNQEIVVKIVDDRKKYRHGFVF